MGHGRPRFTPIIGGGGGASSPAAGPARSDRSGLTENDYVSPIPHAQPTSIGKLENIGDAILPRYDAVPFENCDGRIEGKRRNSTQIAADARCQ